MATETEIFNMGVALVGGSAIANIDAAASDSDSAELVLARLFYDPSRDAVLESANWGFAMARATLSEDATPPDFEYDSRFEKPSDCLRVVAVSLTGDFDDDAKWMLEGDYILANADTIYIKYVKQVSDTTLFSSLFVSALSAYLAMVLAIPRTRDNKVLASMQKLYAGLVHQATTMSSQQGSNVELNQNTVSMVSVR